jgi:hypothetical protein
LSKPAYKGVVRGGNVVFDRPAALPEGAEVVVTEIEAKRGSPQTVLAVVDAPPHVDPKDVDTLMRLIEKGKRRIRYANPLTRKRKH